MDWKEIKNDAKDCIKGNRGAFWGYMILSTLIIWLVIGLFVVLISVFSGIFSKIKIVATVINIVLLILAAITTLGLMGAQMAGLMSNMIDVYDGMSMDVGRMFKYTKNLFSCAGIEWGFIWRCMIPILNVISFTKSYAVFYVKADKSYMKGHFCWKEAGKMMDGHKMNFFGFMLSFILKLFFGTLIFPLGIYWFPYIFEAIAVYHAYIVNIDNGGFAAGLDLGIDTTPMPEEYVEPIAQKPVREPKPKKEKPVKAEKPAREPKQPKEPKPKREKPAKEPKEKKGLRPAK